MSQNACTSSFSLLGHSHSANDIVSGIFSVARGGTGCSSLTSGNILLGNGTGAITSTSVLAPAPAAITLVSRGCHIRAEVERINTDCL